MIEETREIAIKNPESIILKICEDNLSLITETTAYEAMLLGENLLKPVREKMYESIFSRETTLPMLKLSEMGSASVLVGAGMLGAYKKQL